MKEYKYKINGNSYKVTIGDVVFNISNGNFIYVTVNFIFIFFHRFILLWVTYFL